MVVLVADVKKMLPNYSGLQDDQIQEAIDVASSYLDGVNKDWADMPKADTIWKLASVSFTLKLHFPQNVDAYNSLDNNVMDMVNSMWSSANMINKKTGYCRLVGSKK
ncbi:MAG: hypothetical protein K8E24_013040 [Methanobacterium paludis]|nr:hypothetical protein [Methanobacterium paludis]